ncbi:MAG TPA: MBL fold metallo-hydrolase [Mariniphaga sp.]|nr:MBL fold metallo-hydrolase [Mariniphaga sp.]
MQDKNNQVIEAVFLGTGTSQGVPVIGCQCDVCRSIDTKDKRLRSSLLLKINNMNIVIDAGPDFRQQMLRENINQLRAILITHEHVDHVFGLDDIRSFNWLQKKPTDIYAEKRVQDDIQRIFYYVFSKDKYPGIPSMNLHTIDNQPFKIDDIIITPIRCYHHKLPVYGFRIGNLSYITDTNYIPPEELLKLKGSEILIINALRVEKHISHFNLKEALDVIREINPQKAFLTHISHGFGTHNQIQALLPMNVYPAYDGLTVKTNG